MTATKVTVVIPTRERPDTLAKSLKTALNQDWPNLEVIVSDNNSGPATAAVVQAMNDPRITYLNTGQRLSMSHNWEFAISAIKEGWITLIGDDDGLLPNSLGRVVRLVEKHGLEALSSRTCFFNWPSGTPAGEAILSVPMGRGETILDAKQALRRLMNWEFDGLALPFLYTGGLISADLVDRIRSIKGTFFQSQIPDVYSGVAITSAIDRFVFTREPFAITGASQHSTGAATARFRKTAFLDEDNIPFHEDIPLPSNGTFTFSLPAMVCEAFLQSQYLRADGPNMTNAEILELILDQTSAGRDLLEPWARAFADKHKLTLSSSTSPPRTKLARKLSLLRFPFKLLVERYRIDSKSRLMLSDSFEASLAAATILATRPNRLPSIWRTMLRLSARRSHGTAANSAQGDAKAAT